MRPPYRSLPLGIAIAVAMVAMAGLGASPAFAGLGAESAIVAGLLLPALAAAATALDVVLAVARPLRPAPAPPSSTALSDLSGSDLVTRELRAALRPPEPIRVFYRGVTAGAAIAGAGWLACLGHTFRVGACDALAGTAAFALGPGAGAVLGGVWGAVAGQIAARTRRPWHLAPVLAAAAPAIGVVLSVWRTYSSPAVFAFDPFFGYWSGALHDAPADALVPLLTYRAGSAMTLVAVAALGAHLGWDDRGRLGMRWIRRPGAVLVGALAAAGSVLVTIEGWRLGHWHTAHTLRAELGGLIHGERCDLVFPRALLEQDAWRLARDCDEHVRAAEKWLETIGPRRLTAFVFPDASAARRLVGTTPRAYAKPWRAELYVRAAPYPHPDLGRVVAQVVASAFARGPAKSAGDFLGLRSLPAITEGLGVATSPPDDDLTPAEWARAMREAGLLPPLRALLGASPAEGAADRTWTAAGAFVGWVRRRYGAAAVQRWYQGDSLETVAQSTWDDLEAAWHDDLRKLSVPDGAAQAARARFDRRPRSAGRCPELIGRLRRLAEGASAAGDPGEARARLERARQIDPADVDTRLALAACLVGRGHRDEARWHYAEIEGDDRLAQPVRDRARAATAEIDFAWGNAPRAAAAYRDLAARTIDGDLQRVAEIRARAADSPRALAAVAAPIAQAGDRDAGRVVAAALLGAWAGDDAGDGLPDYLLGRDFADAGRWADAAARLDRALGRKLPDGAVRRDAVRTRIVAACALADGAGARGLVAAWNEAGEPRAARREWVQRLVDRCAPDKGK